VASRRRALCSVICRAHADCTRMHTQEILCDVDGTKQEILGCGPRKSIRLRSDAGSQATGCLKVTNPQSSCNTSCVARAGESPEQAPADACCACSGLGVPEAALDCTQTQRPSLAGPKHSRRSSDLHLNSSLIIILYGVRHQPWGTECLPRALEPAVGSCMSSRSASFAR